MDKSITLQVGVKVFLKNKNGKYLLLKRSQIRYPTIKNFWDIPGGRILPGTSLPENIKREVFEETKLTVLSESKLIFVQDILRSEKHIVRLTFSSTATGTPVLNEEHTEYKWLPLQSMLHVKELDEFTREVVEKNLVE